MTKPVLPIDDIYLILHILEFGSYIISRLLQISRTSIGILAQEIFCALEIFFPEDLVELPFSRQHIRFVSVSSTPTQ